MLAQRTGQNQGQRAPCQFKKAVGAVRQRIAVWSASDRSFVNNRPLDGHHFHQGLYRDDGQALKSTRPWIQWSWRAGGGEGQPRLSRLQRRAPTNEGARTTKLAAAGVAPDANEYSVNDQQGTQSKERRTVVLQMRNGKLQSMHVSDPGVESITIILSSRPDVKPEPDRLAIT